MNGAAVQGKSKVVCVCASVYRTFTAITSERKGGGEDWARYQFPVLDYVSRREGENMTSQQLNPIRSTAGRNNKAK